MKRIFLAVLLINLGVAQAQEEVKTMDLDMSSHCQEVLTKKFPDLDCETIAPIELEKVDDENQRWKFRFHFGFSRTDYWKTDLHINSGFGDVVVKDVEMHERTSSSHYNPANWDKLENSFKWIDEPTNTFTFSMEKKNDVFYLTIFHPKYLKSIVYKKTEVDGEEQIEFSNIEESDSFSQNIPEGHGMIYLGNTHMNLVTQVGYGRMIEIFVAPRFGRLTFIPRLDVGINTGLARSVHIVRGERWDDYYDNLGVQGYNASAGARLEYQKGKVSMFVDSKVIYSRMNHGFFDGTIKYDLVSTPITFGLGIDVFSGKKKKKNNF
jgi:hypothetical protein